MQDEGSSVKAEGIGDVIDRYTLVQEIGRGGMGVVWMAQQEEPVRRKVALKVIKLGMDTKEVVARFEAERQALALMNHPHIAKVFDGGATGTGRPYFVMELVDGAPITEYCDRVKLGLRDRLELFKKVCEAIQHAHLKGIIHRDIKPSNVLVAMHDDVPVPKVIDFGIAKATSAELSQKSMFTQHGQIVGTLEYMAPEQTEMFGVDIDTRADVYALGALLYEMLSGATLFDLPKLLETGYDELLRTIREVDPVRPSTRICTLGDSATAIALNRHANVEGLRKRLRGDLDWIVTRALEKDRTRRYETPNSLAADIARYLNNESVEAHPPSAFYRLHKFVRRRKKTVVAAATILLLLIGGSTGTGVGWWKTSKANKALDVALEEKTEALRNEEAQRTLADINEKRARAAEAEAIQEAKRATNAEAEATKRAEEREQVATFQAEQLQGIDPELMGIRLRRSLLEPVPEEQRRALEQSLVGINFTTIALETLRENLFGRTVQAIDSQFAEQPLVQAQLLQTIADTLFALGLLEEATDPQERALSIRRMALGDEHPDTLVSINNMGILLRGQGKLPEAEPYHREALETSRRTLGEEAPLTLGCMNNMGLLFQSQGKLSEAEPYYRKALEARRRTLGDEHPETLASISNLGVLLLDQGKLSEAESYYREALEASRRTQGDEHLDTLGCIQGMGILLRNQGKLSEAEPYYREALKTARRTLGDEHPLTLRSINNLGLLLQYQGKLSEAEPYCREALEARRRILGDEHPYSLVSINNLGLLLYKQGRLSEAEPYYREAIKAARRTLGDKHRYTVGFNSNLGLLLQDQLDRSRRAVANEPSQELALAQALADNAAHMVLQGEFVKAESFIAEALELLKGLEANPTMRSTRLRSQLALIIAKRGRFEEAEALVIECVQRVLRSDELRSWEDTDGIDAGVEIFEDVIELYDGWHTARPAEGHDEEAETWRGKLEAWIKERITDSEE